MDRRRPMLNVGLTGGIASGKSTVAKMLTAKGAELIDLDELAHSVEAPDGEVWRAIVRRFGPEILAPDRTIDRRKLGDIVFGDPQKRELLNSLVHPAVVQEWRRRLADIRRARPEAVVLSDVPLLFEAGLQPLVDLVLLVYIPPEEQLRRLMTRDGYGREEALARIAAQLPIDVKLREADLVIRNDGSVAQTRRAVDEIWEELRGRERGLRESTGKEKPGVPH